MPIFYPIRDVKNGLTRSVKIKVGGCRQKKPHIKDTKWGYNPKNS